MKLLLVHTMRVAALAPALALALAAGGCSEEAASGGDSTTAALLSSPAGDGMSTPIAADPSLQTDGPRIDVAALGFNRGEESAIVKVVELSDFGCGYCKQFHAQSFPAIRDEFIETGMVEWKFVPYVTGMFDNSLAATEAGECVMEQSPEAYERISARMWEDQSTWKSADEPEPVLRGWVSGLGVDMTAYDACLSEDRRLNRIASATTLARQVGVRGTPTFIVLGYPPLQGALPLEMFRNILGAVHAEEARLQAESDSSGAPPTDTPGR